jgi:methylmalonyl-CoA/ethylmalonyl-CoA epimerase
MSTSIHHIAVAVHDLDTVLTLYRDGLRLEVTERREVPEEGVEIAFLPAGEGAIELLEPLGEDSSVARFLEKNGEGLHHVCLAVGDIEAAMAQLRAAGARMLNREPRVDVLGTRYAFVSPRSVHGVLLELYGA